MLLIKRFIKLIKTSIAFSWFSESSRVISPYIVIQFIGSMIFMTCTAFGVYLVSMNIFVICAFIGFDMKAIGLNDIHSF